MTVDLDRAERLIRRWRDLQGQRGAWLPYWDDLTRVMMPFRQGFVTQTAEGDRRADMTFDGTPMWLSRALANAIGGMLRPTGEDWVFLKAEDDETDGLAEAQDWLAMSEERLRAALYNPKARLLQATGEIDWDLVVLGTGVLFVGERRRLNRLLFQSVHLKDAVVAFSDDGAPEGVFRCRRFAIRQMIDLFGEANLSDSVKEKIRANKLDDRIECLHAVLPRPHGRADAVLARNLPFTDTWIEIDSKNVLADGGYHEMPYVIPRWDTSSGEEYGRSPGMIALPDANTLQAMGETLLVGGQRAADPPIFAPSDGSFSEVNAFPGSLTYYDVETAAAVRGNPFFALESGRNMPLTRDMQQDVRAQVANAFLRNVLNLPTEGPEMTATEIIQRNEEFLREVGPVFGRLESDYTAPMVERSFKIMLRAGAFDPIPDVLKGRNIRIEYESPVKRVRQRAQAAAASAWAQSMMVLAEAKPGALDLVNEDGLGRFSAEALGIPREAVSSEDSVQATREARAQAQQAQAQAEQLAAAADIASRGAKAAKDAGLIAA